MTRHAVAGLRNVAPKSGWLWTSKAGIWWLECDRGSSREVYENERWEDESVEEAQGVLILEADAVVHAICRRLTESAPSCTNLSSGAIIEDEIAVATGLLPVGQEDMSVCLQRKKKNN